MSASFHRRSFLATCGFSRPLGRATPLLALLAACTHAPSSATESGDDALSASDPAHQSVADWFCAELRPGATLTDAEYAARFDASVTATTPASAIRGYFTTTMANHGACAEATYQSFASDGEAGPGQTFFLTMNDKMRVAVTFELTDAGKIARPGLGSDSDIGILGPASNYDVNVYKMPAPDGAALRTIVFRRPGTERRPTVLLRTPYFRLYGHFQYAHYFATADYYMNEGYDFVLQAIRGTGGSEGDYRFMSPQEIDDGAAAVRWSATRTRADGNVAVVGVSYDGFTALAAAVKNPEGLKVVMAGGSPTEAASGPFIRNGLVDVKQLDYIRYNLTQTGPVFMQQDDPTAFNQLLLQLINEPDIRTYDTRAFGASYPEWQTLANHMADAKDPFWSTRQIFDRVREIDVPTYHIAGIRKDGDMLDVLKNFTEVSANAPHPERHRLILGYWDHGASIPYDGGQNAGQFIQERYRPLLAYYLKGIPTPYTSEPRVQVTSNNGDAFIGSDVFPPPMLAPRTVYFTSDGTKQTLSDAPPSGTASSSYEYHPLKTIDLTNPDPTQILQFDYTPTTATPILGYLDFDLYLQLTGLDGDAVAQTDVFLGVMVDGQLVGDCLMGQKMMNDADVLRLQTKGCFIKGVLQPTDTMSVIVLSNLYPSALRNTGGAVSDYFSRFHGATVTLLHSADYPSALSFTTEPGVQ